MTLHNCRSLSIGPPGFTGTDRFMVSFPKSASITPCPAVACDAFSV